MSNSGTATITTPLGDIVVRDTGGTIRATGVRYATAQRFAAPEPVRPWSAPFDATQLGRACPQVPSRLDWVTGPVTSMLEQSEDCLTVTVTAPSPVPTNAPVMVFFHGGAYLSGSGECPAYDPTTYGRRTVGGGRDGDVPPRASRQPRRSTASPPANLSLMDQIAALRWVQSNIASLSAGTRVTSRSSDSPLAATPSTACCWPTDTETLFHRAIMQSAPILLAIGPRRDGCCHGRDRARSSGRRRSHSKPSADTGMRSRRPRYRTGTRVGLGNALRTATWPSAPTDGIRGSWPDRGLRHARRRRADWFDGSRRFSVLLHGEGRDDATVRTSSRTSPTTSSAQWSPHRSPVAPSGLQKRMPRPEDAFSGMSTTGIRGVPYLARVTCSIFRRCSARRMRGTER